MPTERWGCAAAPALVALPVVVWPISDQSGQSLECVEEGVTLDPKFSLAPHERFHGVPSSDYIVVHLRDGEDVLVGETPQSFADAVVRLYTDESLWEHLSHNGIANVERHFSLDAAREVVRRVLLERR